MDEPSTAQAQRKEVQSTQLIEADTADEQAMVLLTNLGFTKLLGRSMQALSGEWRVRTALAAAIFAKPDLLLLDEPATTYRLASSVAASAAPARCGSRAWLSSCRTIASSDETTSDTLHVFGAARKLTQSRGNYSSWLKRRQQHQLTHSKIWSRSNAKSRSCVISTRRPLVHPRPWCKDEAEAGRQAGGRAAEPRGRGGESSGGCRAAHGAEGGGELSGFAVQVKGLGFRYHELANAVPGAEFSIDSKSRIVLARMVTARRPSLSCSSAS